MTRTVTVALFVSALVFQSDPGWTAVCSVPASHPTIQAAVADGSCSEIQVAAGTYPESLVLARSLVILGAGSDQTFVQGQVRVDGVQVGLDEMHISAPEAPLSCHNGGEIDGFNLVVVPGAPSGTVFADGFESGDHSAWPLVVD